MDGKVPRRLRTQPILDGAAAADGKATAQICWRKAGAYKARTKFRQIEPKSEAQSHYIWR